MDITHARGFGASTIDWSGRRVTAVQALGRWILYSHNAYTFLRVLYTLNINTENMRARVPSQQPSSHTNSTHHSSPSLPLTPHPTTNTHNGKTCCSLFGRPRSRGMRFVWSQTSRRAAPFNVGFVTTSASCLECVHKTFKLNVGQCDLNYVCIYVCFCTVRTLCLSCVCSVLCAHSSLSLSTCLCFGHVHDAASCAWGMCWCAFHTTHECLRVGCCYIVCDVCYT